MSTSILYYVFLVLYGGCIAGALGISLKALTSGLRAAGLWQTAAGMLATGVGVAALRSSQGGVDEGKAGMMLAVSIAVLALSLLAARREKEIVDAALLADAGPSSTDTPADLDDTSTLESIPTIEAADEDEDEIVPVATPEEMHRRILIGVVVGLVLNILLALLW